MVSKPIAFKVYEHTETGINYLGMYDDIFFFYVSHLIETGGVINRVAYESIRNSVFEIEHEMNDDNHSEYLYEDKMFNTCFEFVMNF